MRGAAKIGTASSCSCLMEERENALAVPPLLLAMDETPIPRDFMLFMLDIFIEPTPAPSSERRGAEGDAERGNEGERERERGGAWSEYIKGLHRYSVFMGRRPLLLSHCRALTFISARYGK